MDNIRERVQRPLLIRGFNYRKPTGGEILQVAETLENYTGESQVVNGEVRLNTEHLAVIDSYQSDSPGWSGKMATYIGGSHDDVWVFRFTDEGAEVVSSPDR